MIALEASDDQHHEEAVRHWQEIAPELASIVTTTYVFDELVTFFNSRGHHAKAVDIGRRLRASPRVEIVPETESLFEAGWDLFRDRPDKRYSFTDCFSFILMDRRGIERALAFDRHFEQAGYKQLPKRRLFGEPHLRSCPLVALIAELLYDIEVLVLEAACVHEEISHAAQRRLLFLRAEDNGGSRLVGRAGRVNLKVE